MSTQSSLTVAETFQNAQPDTILIFAAAAVFLIAVFLLIRCFQKIRTLSEEMKDTAGPSAQPAAGLLAEAQAPAKAAAPAAARSDTSASMPDLQLIAVITAAIAASENIPADGIVIRSIRRSSNNNWKRA